jgi:predicted DNA-binding transcriptional regulator YafY
MAHVVLRAYGRTADYLRTLPLHDSRQELESTEEYTDFSLDIRPTADFIAELLSYNMGLKVLEPADLRLKICEELKRMLNRY